MKIAVVGAGVAGASAARALQDIADVLVYEQEALAGGHAWTVDVPLPGGAESVAVDAGFQLYHPGVNPNVSALFAALGVATEPVDFSLSSFGAEHAWTNNGHRTPFGDSVAGEIARFLRDVPWIAGLDVETSLERLFASRSYSPDFLHRCLAPLLSFWWVSRASTFAMPAAAVASGVIQGALSFFSPTTWRAVTGGSREYMRRLTAPLADGMLVGTPVRRIERAVDKVVVHDAGGSARPFDEVILAIDAAAALSVLDEPTAEERELLGEIRFESSELVIHRDARVMPPDRALWSYGNYRDTGLSGEPGALGGEMTYWPPRPGRPSVFITVKGPATHIDEAEIVARRTWRHMVFDPRVLSRRLGGIQGKRRTWFCGGHTAGLPVHEHALCSGLAVAEALGAAYPFAGDGEARRVYESVKARVL